jgi:hypothetical protein
LPCFDLQIHGIVGLHFSKILANGFHLDGIHGFLRNDSALPQPVIQRIGRSAPPYILWFLLIGQWDLLP